MLGVDALAPFQEELPVVPALSRRLHGLVEREQQVAVDLLVVAAALGPVRRGQHQVGQLRRRRHVEVLDRDEVQVGRRHGLVGEVRVLVAQKRVVGDGDERLHRPRLARDDVLEDGDSIAVPNDTTNEARALLLLQDNGIITLKDGAGLNATVKDIEENPHNVEIVELEAAQVARVTGETAYVVLNGNYALEAGFSVGKDALAYEKSDSEAAKTYVNVIAVKEGNEDSEKIQALVDVLKSDEIKDFINEKYDGAVIPFEESSDAEEADTEDVDDADSKDAENADTADTAEENADTADTAEDAE